MFKGIKRNRTETPYSIHLLFCLRLHSLLRFCLSLFGDWFAFAQFHSPLALCICSAAAQAPCDQRVFSDWQVSWGHLESNSRENFTKTAANNVLGLSIGEECRPSSSIQTLIHEFSCAISDFKSCYHCMKISRYGKFYTLLPNNEKSSISGRRTQISDFSPSWILRLHNLVRNWMTDNLRL